MSSSNLLEDFIDIEPFAVQAKRHPRTVRRWMNGPDGLPYARIGNRLLNSCAEREGMAALAGAPPKPTSRGCVMTHRQLLRAVAGRMFRLAAQDGIPIDRLLNRLEIGLQQQMIDELAEHFLQLLREARRHTDPNAKLPSIRERLQHLQDEERWLRESFGLGSEGDAA